MITVSNPFSSIPPLFSDLASILAGEMDCSQKTLTKYSNDGSPYSVRPQAVVYPKNSTDIKHVLSFSREYTMPVTIRGNGGSRTGGSLGEGIIIDLSRYFTHIRQINMMEHTITVDAGVSVKNLREKLHGWRMDIPLLTAQDNDSTIGALVSTKNNTPTSFHFGTIREWVEALNVIVDTGEEHRISDGITPSGRLLGIYQALFPLLAQHGPTLRAAKPHAHDDATGYCLWNTSIGPRQLLDQFVGGEGTLGIITTVTLRLVPYKQHVMTTCIPIDTASSLLTITDIAKHHNAEHIFMYDSTFMELSERYHLSVTPSFPNAQYTLCVTHYGETIEELHSTVRNFVRALPLDSTLLQQHDDKHFIERISDTSFLYSLLESYTQGTHTPISVGDGIVVPFHEVSNALAELEEYLYSTGRLYTITGNIGSGHISVVSLFDPLSSNYEKDVDHYTHTLFGIVKKYKGGMSAQGGEGLTRTPSMPLFFNEATMSIFNDVKKIYDPLSILNPGKKLGTTVQYLHNHLLRKER